MVALPKAALDDSYKQLLLTDFKGGLNTNTGALDLAADETPDCLNVIPFPGRWQYRGGYTRYSTLPAKADGAYAFYDSNGSKHYAVWSNGNLYDCVSGAPVLIAAATYTAGQQVGRQDANGRLYYSTSTVTLRVWNPVAGTEAAVVGAYPIPASSFLSLYAGQMIALAPTLTGTPFINEFVWSDVNDPTTWLPANAQQVGGLSGGPLNYISQMGISNSAVAPARQLVVSKATDRFLYSYQGTLGELQESIISSPVGMQDGRSGAFIPAPTGFGYIAFLGQDYQMYITDGQKADQISLNINNTFYADVQQSAASNVFFQGAYNNRYQYYVLDIGNNIQYIYRWQTGALSKFQGWPSGYWMPAMGSNNFPTLFVASTDSARPGLFVTGVEDVDDNGAMPSIYFTTPYLHGGMPNREKEYQWADLLVTNTPGTIYTINGQGLPRQNNTQQTIQQLTLTVPAVVNAAGSPLIWGSGIWGTNIWGSASTLLNNDVVPLHGVTMVPVDEGQWTSSDPEPLRSSAARFTISAAGEPAFNVVGLAIRYLDRGFKFPGAQQYDTENGIAQIGTDPYSTLGGT